MTARGILMNGRSLLHPLLLVLGKSLSAGFVLLALSACSESELILDGDRIAIITASDMIAADPAALAEGAGLPDAIDIFRSRLGHSFRPCRKRKTGPITSIQCQRTRLVRWVD